MDREKWKERGLIVLLIVGIIVIVGTALWKVAAITAGLGVITYTLIQMVIEKDYKSVMYLLSFLVVSSLFLVFITPKRKKKAPRKRKRS
ncbi:hypothetical protein [Metabacillus iocasae]|uniref:Competence protein ComGC n=1 Tax=Priestia iocasae TaxID=2291674 RepID=A0ABS2QTY3_9BACI|nr:hypothetical protein [Metabacillus iocasae]MBM7702926.1 competence protein ComGC [Metabacillus iocasae]